LIRNHLFRPARVQAELKIAPDMICDRPIQNVMIDGKTEVSIPFVIRRTADSRGKREIITADITINGKRLGEYAEAIIDPASPQH
jgi:hypothetical protein